MPFSLPDKWVWDFWFARHEGQHHIFYLQAPRALGDPGLRHHRATIGHAVSADLRDWRLLPDAVHPGTPGCWDDLATWTGSVIDHDGRWYMLYTGINRAEQGSVQRVGLATSDDLLHWSKHPGNPVLEADARWYEVMAHGRWHDESWRDPWLFRSPEDGLFHVLVTARSPHGEPGGAGVLGHARSRDLVEWEVLPPLTEPGEFAQVEVPQLVRLQGGYTILFSCHAEDHSPQRVKRLGADGQGGTFALWAKHFSGPYVATDTPIAPFQIDLGVLYAGKLLEDDVGDWKFMAFCGDEDRDFVGEVAGPLAVHQGANGELVVVTDQSAISLARRAWRSKPGEV